MKRTASIILLVLLAVLTLTSCATRVRVDYLSPSEVDMGRYRNLALASTVPFSGFRSPSFYIRTMDRYPADYSYILSSYDRSLATAVASYMTDALLDELSDTGFFNIIPPERTDGIIARSRAGYSIADEVAAYGIDAFIVPRITSMDVNEYITSQRDYVVDYAHLDTNGNPVRVERMRYYLTQTVSLVYSYTIIDADTMTVYAVKNFSDKEEFTNEITSSFFTAPRAQRYLATMAAAMASGTAYQLVPRSSALYVDLMPNKPKSERAEAAYDLVEDGAVTQAMDLFCSVYAEERHLPSGYNWALLNAVRGNIETAIAILEGIQEDWVNSDVNTLLSQLRTVRSRNDEARAQLSGSSEGGNYMDADNSIFTLVMGV